MSTSRPDLSDFTPDLSDFTPEAASPPTVTPPAKQGFIGALGSDLHGMLQGAINNLAMNTAQRLERMAAPQTNDAARKAAGNPLLYRAPAAIAEKLGVNVSGMEQAGTAGDVGGVLGHAAAMPTAVALTTGAGKAIGGTVGLRTRAAQSFSNIESKIGEAPINHEPVLNTAYKAAEMGAKGFTMPKVVSDFIDWAQAVKASRTPFKFADARDFYTALGEKIPWDQYGGKGGRMYTQIMKMRSQLGDALKATAADNGLGSQYTQALKDYRRAARITQGANYAGSALTGGPVGKAIGLSGGDLMEWLARKAVNAGQVTVPGGAVGSIARSMEPGLSNLDLENIVRRAPGTEAENAAIQQNIQLNQGRAPARQWATGDPNAPANQLIERVRQTNPELFTNRPPNTMTETGAAFDTNVLKQVQAERPDLSLSEQLQEAAIRANKARGR